MADNFDFTEGSGAIGAADDVGGVLFAKVKLDLGTDGASAPALAGAGAVATGVQRITLASDDPAVTLLGTIDTDTGVIAGDTTSIDGKITACNTGAVVLATGSATIGKLAANSGVDIGDVDVTSVPAPLNVVGGGTEAAALRVTIANDSTGLLSVDDNGSSLTVDTTGTSGLEVVQVTAADLNVTEASGVAIKNSVEIMDDWDESDRAKVNPIVGQAGVQGAEGTITALTQRVTLATDDDGVAHLATIAGDTTSIDGKITACNTGAVVLAAGANSIGTLGANSGVDIGDVDVTSIVPGVAATNLGKAEDAGHSTGDVGVMSLAVRFDAGGALAGTDLDYAPMQVDANGALRVTGGGGGTEYTEDVATASPIVGSAVMFERDDVLSALTPVAGDWASMRCSAEGALWVQDFNSDAALALLGTIDTDTGVIAGDTTSIDGKITACNTGAVVISSGTVTTVSTVTNLAQMAGAAITMDEGVHGGGVQRVTIATDDDGVISLGIMEDWDESDRCKVNPIAGQAGVQGAEGVINALTQRVTIATDDEVNNLLTTIDSDTNDIKTAVEIMDDWDATHDAAASADGPQLMAAYDTTKPAAVADGDAVRVLADEYGRLLSGVEKTAWQATYNSADASGEGETVHASAASTIIVVQHYMISVDAEIWVELQEEDSSELTGKLWLKAGGGTTVTLPDKCPLILGVDSDLEVITEGAGNVSVTATGYTIPG